MTLIYIIMTFGFNMNKNENELLSKYLSNLYVNVTLSGFNKVSERWRDIDYTPEYNKFYLILDGEGWLRIGDKDFYPRPGQLFMMPQGVKQSYSAINKNTFTKHWCHFTAQVGDINLFDIIKVPYFIDLGDYSEIEPVFAELNKNLESTEFQAPLILKSCILRIIYYYLRNVPSDSISLANPHSMEKLSDVLSYIDSNYNKNISIDELAGIVHLQPQYFIRLFRKHMGTSPIHYLNNKRMEQAKWFLQYSSLSIKEIAEKIGIEDVYYFSKVFKEYSGFSPSAYRQMISQ